MTPPNKTSKITRTELALLIALPALIAAVYILPPLYARYAAPAPHGTNYSQYALGQLYNYDEYGLYQPVSDSIASGSPPYADLFTYESRDNKTLIPYFAPFYLIALVKIAVNNNELVMPALDILFAIIGFLAVYMFTLAIAPSRKTAIIAAALTLLPPPILRIIEIAGMGPDNGLLRAMLFTNELPMMSRTYNPQMTIPIMLLFLALTIRVENGDSRKRVALAAAALIAASFYFSFIFGVILSLIAAKLIIRAAASKNKDRLISTITIAAAGAVLSLHNLWLSVNFNRQIATSDLDKFMNSETINRLSAQNIAATTFFIALYIVHATPSLKKPAFAVAVASIPAALLITVKGCAAASNFYMFTPAIYLLFAASIPNNNKASNLFIYMSAAMETALLLRIVTGKSHADVHYFYRTFFLPLAPILIATGTFAILTSSSWPGIVRALKNKKLTNAAFIATAVAVIILGATANLNFASKNRLNYYIPSDQARAAAWLRNNAEHDSVVMSLDPQTNLYIRLTTQKYLLLPRPGMSPFSFDKLVQRLAVASALLGVNPDKINWRFWPSLGFYMFDMHTTNPKCKQALVNALKTSPPSGSGQFKLDYLWYGPHERQLASINPDNIPQLRKIYSTGSISIYKFTKKHPLFAPGKELR